MSCMGVTCQLVGVSSENVKVSDHYTWKCVGPIEQLIPCFLSGFIMNIGSAYKLGLIY